VRTGRVQGSNRNRASFLFEVLDGMSKEISSQKVGVKFSSQIAFNDIEERDADEIYPHIRKRR